MYRTTRYISAAEATWRMLGFESQSRYPSVTRVHAHLENENSVVYPAEASAEERAAIASNTTSDLMHYLKRPTAACFSRLTLLDYIITKKKKMTPAHLLLLSGSGLINMVTSFPPEPQNMYAVSISKALLLATFSTFDSSCTKYLQGRY